MKTGAVYFVCFFLFLLTAGCMHGTKSRGGAERFVALPVSDSAVLTGTDPFVYLKPAGGVAEYRKRMALQRFTGVPVTHPDAYKIETQQPVYAPRVTRVVLDVINLDAPAAGLWEAAAGHGGFTLPRTGRRRVCRCRTESKSQLIRRL